MFKFSLGSFGAFLIFAHLVHVVSWKRLIVVLSFYILGILKLASDLAERQGPWASCCIFYKMTDTDLDIHSGRIFTFLIWCVLMCNYFFLFFIRKTFIHASALKDIMYAVNMLVTYTWEQPEHKKDCCDSRNPAHPQFLSCDIQIDILLVLTMYMYHTIQI